MKVVVVGNPMVGVKSVASELKNAKVNQMIVEVLNGNSRAFDKLWEMHQGALMFHEVRPKTFGDEDLANDLLQEICIRAYERLHRFNPEKAVFSTWLFKIAKNFMIDVSRRKKLDKFRMNDQNVNSDDESISSEDAIYKYKKDTLDQYETPHSTMASNEIKMAFEKLLSSFKPPMKKILELYFYENLSYDMISQEMNMPLNTIKTYIHRGKMELQQKAKERNYIHFLTEC